MLDTQKLTDLEIEDIKACAWYATQVVKSEEVHAELKKMLEAHTEDELRQSFCTVEPGRHRIRSIPTIVRLLAF